MHLGRLEIHIILSNPNIDFRTLTQGYCVAIVSLSLLLTWHWTHEKKLIRKALFIKQESEWIEWFHSSILIPSMLELFR